MPLLVARRRRRRRRSHPPPTAVPIPVLSRCSRVHTRVIATVPRSAAELAGGSTEGRKGLAEPRADCDLQIRKSATLSDLDEVALSRFSSSRGSSLCAALLVALSSELNIRNQRCCGVKHPQSLRAQASNPASPRPAQDLAANILLRFKGRDERLSQTRPRSADPRAVARARGPS
ncbi:hypothetical protein DMC30DRAFT_59255 [Rhodotorula diobovata]|uniref:Uncharacterized protein n=1 Tax=Rhodotorula diobovata TaxID=5288 RepID=A0A5C5FR27_9BASI|nr:hypothetical protein DMC30DRAFT_59255 [Rhodotorula diobovata]